MHEGPHRISRVMDTQPLHCGMIVSNEPGYYVVNEFGIRIENLLEVVNATADGSYLAFKPLTHIPIQKNLIEVDLMERFEIKWLDDYHSEVRNQVMPLLTSEESKAWLLGNTSPLLAKK